MATNIKDGVICYKVITIGCYGIGKTSLIKRYCENPDAKEPFDLLSKSTTVNGKKCEVQIWDTQGMEEISSITSFYYNDAHGALIMADLSNEKGFDDFKEWIESMGYYESKEVAKQPIKIAVGTKSDQQKIGDDKLQAVAEECGIKWFKISNTTGEGIDALMDCLIKDMKEKFNNDLGQKKGGKGGDKKADKGDKKADKGDKKKEKGEKKGCVLL